MIPFLTGAFVLGAVTAAGAEYGREYLYPWAKNKAKDLVEACKCIDCDCVVCECPEKTEE